MRRRTLRQRITALEARAQSKTDVLWHLVRTVNAMRKTSFGLQTALRRLEKGDLKLTQEERGAIIEACRAFRRINKPLRDLSNKKE